MRRSLNVFVTVAAVAAAVSVGVIDPGGDVSVAHAAPSGFADSLVTTRSTLTTIEPLPDGRVVVLEKSGKLVRVDDRDGSADVVTLANFAVCSSSERGLLGFALDPAYATSGAVFVYRTIASAAPGGCHNRVSRFQMGEGGLDLGSEQVLVDNISSVAGNHNGGDLDVGQDGYLYIAIGDGGRDPRGDSGSAGGNDAAQDLSLLNGKILRVDRFTGEAAPGNPFSGAGTAACRVRGNTPSTPTTTCREIYAYGLRNPYRIAFDRALRADRFFINDVGQGDREEVNRGSIGANYGWPMREGRCPQGQNPPCAAPPANLVDPVTDYGHDAGQYVTGGAFVPTGVWPSQYDGAYLVADGALGTTWAWTGGVDLTASPVFMTVSRPTDMAFVTGPTGPDLWYVQQNGQVRKVRYQFPPPAGPSGPLTYAPYTGGRPRVLDTRESSPPAPLLAGETSFVPVSLQAPGATAALVNITLVGPQAEGAYATAWSPRAALVATSNVNAPVRENVANAAIVPVVDGGFMLFTSVTSHVVVDVLGSFVAAPDATSAGRFVTTGPERVVDTRDPVGPANDFTRVPDGVGERVSVTVAGRVDVPTQITEATAVVVTLTGIDRDGLGGFVTAFNGSGPPPLASNLNVGPFDVRANLAVVPVGSDGRVGFHLEGVDDLVVDVVGYVTGPGSPSQSTGRFHLLPPQREADSRTSVGFGRLAAGQRATLNPGTVPDAATGVAQNLTVTRTLGRGFVTAYPSEPLPIVSNVNWSGAGQARAAFSVTRLAPGGTEILYAGDAATDLVVDVFGYFD